MSENMKTPNENSNMDEIIKETTKEIIREKVKDILTDDVLERYLNENEIDSMIRMVFNTFNDASIPNASTYTYEKMTSFRKIVSDNVYKVLNDKVAALLETEEYQKSADQVSRKIVDTSREIAEKYLIEGIAKRMVGLATDFNGEYQKIDMHMIAAQIMQTHYDQNHSR